ncbi:hypothetical protein BGW38_005315 [Lunasporangiospora selenospora]|uniref:RING-type domain-containing protein n=1 Tax=Lunasporangiospora selenospora TaxID=979761 RepID=A0A9P6KH65_9FUNG|nr:hypothetical protein BGW38_005315 [Lunasporangiospora selenospora]
MEIDPEPPINAGESSTQASSSNQASSESGRSTSREDVSFRQGISTPFTQPKALTVPVVDEKAQSELRRKIMDIQRDPSIKFADKAAMIQKLMSSGWQGSQRSNDNQRSGSQDATEEDLKTTFFAASTTGEDANCRPTVVEGGSTAASVMMIPTTTRLLGMKRKICFVCIVKQFNQPLSTAAPVTPALQSITVMFASSGTTTPESKYITAMNAASGEHKCIERNLECDCPICGEYMFTSTTTVIFMPCGHCIHSKCFEDYIKTSYQCPTCWKSLGDMKSYYSKIDSILAEQTMPPEYANIFSIVLCNDCEIKSETPYHFLYHRCDQCKGYNTKVLETFKRVSDGQVQVVENAASSSTTDTLQENNSSGGNASMESSSSSDPGATGQGTGESVNLVNVDSFRSPLMDENASGDMTMTGISGNSAP